MSQTRQFPSSKLIDLLSRLLLEPSARDVPGEHAKESLSGSLLNLSAHELDDLLLLASSNHVIVRGLEAFLRVTHDALDEARFELIAGALEAERARIRLAIPFLYAICREFEKAGHNVAVIKSLDHMPDLGSDLDLYTDADPLDVLVLMKQRFDARVAPQSWGDRLARKWNFLIPGLPELVEVHIGRLGQTGEQVAVASSLLKRARKTVVGDMDFRIPSVSDRLLISTLQRMYRHFYFRLCDIVDGLALAHTDGIDYFDLRSSAVAAGIWEGVATYLVIVSDYATQYGGTGLDLPGFVRAAARFSGDAVYYGRGFLRVPILPQSAGLYTRQLGATLQRRQLRSTARLSLLPLLATAAVIGEKVTGSDKGIW